MNELISMACVMLHYECLELHKENDDEQSEGGAAYRRSQFDDTDDLLRDGSSITIVCPADVRYWHLADVEADAGDVRFRAVTGRRRSTI
jgi:hypothetical protein